MKEKLSVYDVITKQITDKLEQGTIPWRRPWNVASSRPKNLVSDKEYKGINTMLLGCQAYSSPYWLTYKQATERGGNVVKGEKSTPIIFWKKIEAKDKAKDDYFCLRYYNVFNVEQCEGLTVPSIDDNPPLAFHPIDEAERIQLHMPNRPAIDHRGGQACYSPSFDKVTMPPKETFLSAEEYYSTLFHELGHSTGHVDRLNRETITKLAAFGSHTYSQEELIAEFTAAFLCGHCHISNVVIDNSAAYINGWLKKLKSNPKWLVMAASKATKAANYILNVE